MNFGTGKKVFLLGNSVLESIANWNWFHYKSLFLLCHKTWILNPFQIQISHYIRVLYLYFLVRILVENNFFSVSISFFFSSISIEAFCICSIFVRQMATTFLLKLKFEYRLDKERNKEKNANWWPVNRQKSTNWVYVKFASFSC